jgi:sigma-B regulation protein RsbU (phosphoserine phosphatase)
MSATAHRQPVQEKAQKAVTQARRFVREYTHGLNVRDLRRMFDEDATHAYKVLIRDYDPQLEPVESKRRLFYRAKIVFLGLSYKLSPARRLLFLASLLFAVLGLANTPNIDFGSPVTHIHLEAAPLWFLLSIGALLWLLIIELVDRVRVRDELEVARKLQSDLLPESSPEIEPYHFAHSYRTANEVGGDYYDFQQLPDGRLALLIGDASGHGIAAGLLMAIANATLKTALDLDPEPRAVASLLNGALYRTGDRRAFMTLFYGLLDPETGHLQYVCAGHPFPLLRRAGGEIEELGQGTLPLGLRQTVELSTNRVTIEPGDLLVLFTDGLPEAVSGQDGEAFGFDRLRGLVGAVGSPRVIHDRILLAFDQHVGPAPLTDDLTLVVMART